MCVCERWEVWRGGEVGGAEGGGARGRSGTVPKHTDAECCMLMKAWACCGYSHLFAQDSNLLDDCGWSAVSFRVPMCSATQQSLHHAQT